MKFLYLVMLSIFLISGCSPSNKNESRFNQEDLSFINEKRSHAFDDLSPLETVLLYEAHRHNFRQAQRPDQEMCGWESLIEKGIVESYAPLTSPDFYPRIITDDYDKFFVSNNKGLNSLVRFFNFYRSRLVLVVKNNGYDYQNFFDRGYIMFGNPVDLGELDGAGQPVLHYEGKITEKGDSVAQEIFSCP